ncbi:DNA polymerase III subunit alpha [Engelhardtia mirabilis]|uniref:DNA polymerase III subunit alpha n=1 Tax=Engelhardtia mirabilis TaxID=2528011 RepID=A0A518BPF0_9BACT|nr:DNA polymerase III subunit alpha [Planctomycetes bacterium Pla133]QDV03140.1 DNA polymerase III subunit alpha [Planctomycetes bacterium Pla86]
MTANDFVHLHVHSEYSLLDGANRIGNLVKACVDDGQTALALTDHGNMFGAIELYKKCRAAEIKPIIGCEVYIARKSRLEPHNRSDNPYSHLTLLARTNEGYQNLIKLASRSYLEGFHVRPRIDMEILAEHAAGISCLSGCLSGEMNQLIRKDKESEAEGLAVRLRDMFGPEHFWLELQRNGIKIQEDCNESLVRINQRTGIPLVGTNDIHYLRHEDCAVQDVLLCINTGAKRSDEKRFKMDTDTLFFRTREEMAHVFRDLPQCLPATVDVAEQVNVEIEFGKYHVPVYDSGPDETPDQLFDRLLEAGLLRFYGEGHTKARERLEYEKRVIRELGFVSYFLIVWDLIKWARDHGIPVGPGRGSAAGSMVAYLLEITKVCPLRYDLLFERFLNAARVSMPDIDIDFCKEGRERVMQYTRDKYGEAYVAQIVTFGTMASRTVVRDVGRVLDVPLGDVNKVAKKIPAGPGAPSLRKAIETDDDLIQVKKDMPELAELFDLSVELEGQVRHISTHAAGVIIADKPVTEYVPLCTQGEDISTQWPAPQLEELGLLKMDYLGLRTLTILERAQANIRKRGGTPPDLDDLPEGDPATYAMLMRGDTLGVFQLESEGMRKLLARLKPDVFEDLIAVLALYRPGPLESGMDEMFIRRKHGMEPIEYPHPVLEPILDDTYGCIVYQEQVMLISNHLGDFSLNEADNLRKAMGKKKPEIMQKFAAQFIDGAATKGCARETSQEIWDNIVKFGGYGFNKSHSTAYAMITYQTAYLKANHRLSFLAGNMSCEMQDSDKIKAFIDDCKKSGIAVLQPDSRYSTWEFEPEGEQTIRFGFGAVKGTGKKAIEAICAARTGLEKEPDLINLAAVVDPQEVNKSTWEALVKAGAFDWTGSNRGALIERLERMLATAAQEFADKQSGQGSMFEMFGGEDAAAAATGPAKNAPDTREVWDQTEILKNEREVLGLYLSGHPLEGNAGLLALLSNTSTTRLETLEAEAVVTIAGLVVGLTENTVKNGRYAGSKMARFNLEDLEGAVQVTVFPRTFEQVREKLTDDTIIVAKAKVEDRGESMALILDDLMTVEDAIGQFQGALVIKVDQRDEPRLAELRGLIDRRKGSSALYLDVEGTDGNTRRVRANRLSVDVGPDLIRELDALLEPGRASLARH